MTNEEIIREFSALPIEARREVADFIAFLRTRYKEQDKELLNNNLEKEKFIGMWKDCKDFSEDASAWVREVRQNEWAK